MFTMNDEGFTNYTDLNQFEQETSYYLLCYPHSMRSDKIGKPGLQLKLLLV